MLHFLENIKIYEMRYTQIQVSDRYVQLNSISRYYVVSLINQTMFQFSSVYLLTPQFFDEKEVKLGKWKEEVR